MNFKRKMKRLARRQLRHDNLSLEDYDKIVEGLRDDSLAAEWEDKITTELRPPWTDEGLKGDMAGIWEWLKAHWVDILRIFIALLPLLILAEAPEEVAKEVPAEEVPESDYDLTTDEELE